MKFIIGKKIGMTQVFDEEGRKVAVTLVRAIPSRVSAVLKSEKSGYNAIQIESIEQKKNKKPFKKEFRENNPERYKVGEEIKVSQFSTNDAVTVVSIGKGKGFSGTIKKHGFSRGPVSHGSNNVRQPGSIGGGYPERVVLGRPMPGRVGGKQVTIGNMRIVDIDEANGLILISGSIPGPKLSKVSIFGTGEKAEIKESQESEEQVIEEEDSDKDNESKAEIAHEATKDEANDKENKS